MLTLLLTVSLSN